MNQAKFRQLAEERILDAAALIAGGRWSYVYYISGYAVECALKACVLARMGETGWIFSEPKVKIEEVFTHNFEKLLKIAGLYDELNTRLKASASAPPNGRAPGPAFVGHWSIVVRWDVASRYATTSENDAKELYVAITDNDDGILPWLRNYW